MPMNLTNNAVSLLASSTLGAAATSFSITSGDEHRFPSADPGSSTVAATWFPVTLIDTVGNREIMKCTKRVGVILTVVRGQEGTAPRIFPVNSRVEVRLTAGSLKDATSDASALTTGIVADGRLPPRLRKFEMQIGAATGNLNSIVEAGHYWVAGGVLNTPVAGINGWVLADVVHADLQLQEFQQYNSANRWRRQKTADGQWQPWVQLFSIKPDEIPIGVITDFAGATAKLPAGWLFCAGQALTIGVAGSAYYALYQVIGAAFNTYAAGPGVPSAITTPAGQFRLPDLRGRVSAGLDTMAGLASANRLTNPTASTTGGIKIGRAHV